MKLINIIPIFLFLHCTHANTCNPNNEPDPWNPDTGSKDINKTNRTIAWFPCSDHLPEYKKLKNKKPFECGTLDVPLNYADRSQGNMQLHLVKLKGNGKLRKGTIIVNFGDPGDSGVERLLTTDPDVVNSLFDGQYDLISFEPRGTGTTLSPPNYSFQVERMFENLFRDAQDPSYFFTEQALRDALDSISNITGLFHSNMTKIFNTKETDFRRFRGTAFVARDIAEIATALGEGNRINYWGFSYGTVIGQVLAGMFPKRIDLMLLEGNLLADDYVQNLGLNSTRDAEKALYHFYDECMAAPNNKCLSATKLPKNRDEFLEVFHLVFLAYPALGDGFSSSKSFRLDHHIHQALYNLDGYGRLDKLIYNALKTNLSDPLREWPPSPKLPDLSTLGPKIPYLAIWCSDATPHAETTEEIISLFKGYQDNDDPFVLLELLRRSPCLRWNTHAAELINLTTLSRVETNNTILVVNGKYDPATALGNAREISARFGSHVVIHSGVGVAHDAILSKDFSCTRQIVKNYFVKRIKPTRELTCPDTENAFVKLARQREAGKRKTLVYVWVVLGVVLGFVCLGVVFWLCKRK